MTPEELSEFLREKGYSATWLAYTLGVTKATTGRWLSKETPIPETVDKLLRILIRGENPFKGISPEIASGTTLNFNSFEWRVFEVLRAREGFASVEDWIVDKIRMYVGLSGSAQKVAESINTYNQPKIPVSAEDLKKAGETLKEGAKKKTTYRSGKKQKKLSENAAKKTTTMLRALPDAPKANDKKA